MTLAKYTERKAFQGEKEMHKGRSVAKKQTFRDW